MKSIKRLHLLIILIFAVVNSFILYLFLLGLPYGIEPFLVSIAHWDQLSPRIEIVSLVVVVAAIGALLLSLRLPSEVKNGLLYLRWRFTHPAHNVFLTTRRQPFESTTALNAFPEVRHAAFSAGVQTEVWQRLHAKNSAVPVVMNTRMHWQMLRDIYLLSVFYLLLFGAGWLFNSDLPFNLVALYLFLYGAQFLFLMLAARRVGFKFVDNVLAVELGMGEDASGKDRKGKKRR